MRTLIAVVFATGIATTSVAWLSEPVGYGAWAMRTGDGERVWLVHGGVMTRTYCEVGSMGADRYVVTGVFRGILDDAGKRIMRAGHPMETTGCARLGLFFSGGQLASGPSAV